MANRCFLCQRKEETIAYLLHHCGITRVLWDLFFSLFGVLWVFPSSVRQTLEGWRGSFVGKKRKEVWKAGPLCIFWTIWKARNKLAFEDANLYIQTLKSSFMYSLWVEIRMCIKEGPSMLMTSLSGWGPNDLGAFVQFFNFWRVGLFLWALSNSGRFPCWLFLFSLELFLLSFGLLFVLGLLLSFL